eukprot:TRINITY_DN14566_c0_g1_i1.p1 TRINITY_DN14566_c0_g1~~TRINITY_DN14566_c0_g1_i1.p1  ORF type:complete len:110 (+),score=9.10 TRINITY_DN14566_c0_g1_i1:64-393(+)
MAASLFKGIWLPVNKPEEIEGVEPDPVRREHRQVVAKPYKGYVPTNDDIQEYKERCHKQCVDENGMGSAEWAVCRTVCAKEIQQLLQTSQNFRSAVAPRDSQESSLTSR